MKLYDLTGTLQTGMWDYGEPFVPYGMRRISSMEEDGYVASHLTLTTHTGTHMECAGHFGEERTSIDEISLDNFIGEAVLIDVSDICTPGRGITGDDLKKAGAEALAEGKICVMRTGWEKNWNREGYVDNYPYLTVEGAEFLAEKRIKLLATDIPIIGDPHNTETDMVLCENEIPSVYSLVNLAALPAVFTFAAFPLKIDGGDGSPVRAVAWE